jgi:tRNA1Val (adenine37-N6)-methyltransferase
MPSHGFQFQQFYIAHDQCAHKVGTDGVLIAAWAQPHNPEHILDVGCGSGLIALICAQRFSQAKIEGIEQAKEAYAQAQQNVVQSPFANRIQLLQGDFATFRFRGMYDCIISNPPFFDGTTSSGNVQRDQARATIGLSHARLAQRSAELLTQKGSLWLILPKTEAQQFIKLATQTGLHLHKRCKVVGTPNGEDKRWMLCFEKNKAHSLLEENLVLRKADNSYSAAYTNLCTGLYL